MINRVTIRQTFALYIYAVFLLSFVLFGFYYVNQVEKNRAEFIQSGTYYSNVEITFSDGTKTASRVKLFDLEDNGLTEIHLHDGTHIVLMRDMP